MPFKIVRNDITKMQVDAIVNAANPQLKEGSGVCGAIFKAAGAVELQKACDRIGPCAVGSAAITGGYKLPAKYIIHAVGPRWVDGKSSEEEHLRSCYTNSLRLALEHGCESIAFPLISSGIFKYPKEQALAVAVSEIGKFLMQNELMVYLTVFDKEAFALSEKVFSAVEKYIDDHYVDEHLSRQQNSLEYRIRNENPYESKSMSVQRIDDEEDALEAPMAAPMPAPMQKASLADFISSMDESFSQALFRLIDAKGKTDVETYKRANIDRRLFSKIKSDDRYRPSKLTAIAFTIALELNLDETRELLYKAGFTLSHSSRFDLIIEFFILQRNYDIHKINETLYYYDQSLLGA